LSEKELAFDGKLLHLHKGEQFDPEYLKLNPNAVVPTLVHDGVVVTESTVINEYLDEAFPAKPLRPADPYGHARVRLWTKKEDTIHDAINTMTATIIFRHDLMQKTPAEREARYSRMPDPAKRQKWQRMMEEGLDASVVMEALVRFARHFRDMEKALSNGPWLTGKQFTLADAGLLSFFFRLEMLQAKGLWADHYPRVTD
jgi:glutathione S-transferase